MERIKTEMRAVWPNFPYMQTGKHLFNKDYAKLRKLLILSLQTVANAKIYNC